MKKQTSVLWAVLAAITVGGIAGCADEPVEEKIWDCVVAEEDPDFATQIGCLDDYKKLSSNPVSASIPGALSVKTVIDRADENSLYFQDSIKYPVHYAFASTFLSGDGLPIVASIGQFNQTEYYSPDRRFMLGALNYYEGPDVWAYEISPYDSATADMIEESFLLIADNSYVGNRLFFHPTSDAVAREAEKLPSAIPIITTDELFAGIDYQPLNLGTSMGQLRFLKSAQLATNYLSFRDIVVLDAVPNDISVCNGIITQEFQTPLSHINVLSQNRGTPNMGLKGAWDNEELRALDGKWIELVVGAFDYTVEEVTKEEADAWWEANKPDAVQVPSVDLSVATITDLEDILDLASMELGDALDTAIPAFGGKASHYAAFPHMPDLSTGPFPAPKGFAIPIYFYYQFLEQNGFDAQIASMLADYEFNNAPSVREQMLENLRTAMREAPVDAAFEAALIDKLNTEYPGIRMRFRSSTNAEDLDGFTGAGLYTSKSGDPADPLFPVLDAIRTVWSSIWYYRAYEEREYRSIDHMAVGMALLVHMSFPDEDANGVAVTSNIFDPMVVEPGFYINVQAGEASVVKPDPGVTSEQFVLHYDFPGQPIVYMTYSNLVPAGETVLTRSQVLSLGEGLKVIHTFFNGTYGPHTPDHFYAMDTEFKFDGPTGEDPALFIKQTRPYPGWGI